MAKARTLDAVLTPIVIDDVHPRTPGGFPAKAVGGERVPVSAQLVADGHDRLGARVRWRRKGDRTLGVGAAATRVTTTAGRARSARRRSGSTSWSSTRGPTATPPGATRSR